MIRVAKALLAQQGAQGAVNAKFLLVKRSPNSKFFPDLWDLPGGKVEPGEEVKKAVVREAQEETGLVIEPNKIMQEFSFTEQGTAIDFSVFSAKVIGGQLRLSKDHAGFIWASKEEMRKMVGQLTPAVKLYFLL